MAIVNRREKALNISWETYCAEGILRSMRAKDKPAGFPKNPMADIGFWGVMTASLKPQSGNMNVYRRSAIGVKFPEVDGVIHDDIAKAARAASRISNREYKKKVRAKKIRYAQKAKALAVRFNGEEPNGPFAGIVHAAAIRMVIEDETAFWLELERKAKQSNDYHSDRDSGYFGGGHHDNLSQGVRKPSPVEDRESTLDSLKKGTHGASKDAPRKQLHAGDGITPPHRSRTAPDDYRAAEIKGLAGELERHQRRLADVKTIAKKVAAGSV